MKKRFAALLLLMTVLITFSFTSVSAEDDVLNFKKKSFYEMLSINDLIGEKREDVTIPYENAEQMLSMTEEERSNHAITNFQLFDEAIPSILENCNMEQGDIVLTNGYISDVICLPDEQKWQRFDIERNGEIRLIIKGYSIGDANINDTICIRTYEKNVFELNEGDRILISGTFMKKGCVNDTDVLYDCKIEKFEEAYPKNFVTEEEKYLYMIAKDILNSNFGAFIDVPDILYNSNDIYMHHSDNICEIVGRVDILENSRISDSKKFDIEFFYQKALDSNDYSYQALYVYIDGYNPLGEYVLID